MMKKLLSLVIAMAVLLTSGILPHSTVAAYERANNSKYQSALSNTNPVIVFAGLLADNQAPQRLRDESIGLGDVEDVFRLSKLMEDPFYRASDAVWAANNGNLSNMRDYYVAGLIDVIKNQILTEKSLDKTYGTADYFASDTWLTIAEKDPWKVVDIEGQKVDSSIQATNNIMQLATNAAAWDKLYGNEKECKKFYKLLVADDEMKEVASEMGYDTFCDVMTAVKNGKEFIDLLLKLLQVHEVSDEAVQVLKNMKNYTSSVNLGLSRNEQEAFISALDIMIGACDIDLATISTAKYLVNVAGTDVSEYAFRCMIDELTSTNPQFMAAKAVIDGSYLAADLLFQASDMYQLTRTSKAQTDIFRVLQIGMKSAENKVSYCRYQDSSLYVTYIEMLNASYELILDNYERYMKIKVPKKNFLTYGKNLVSTFFTNKGNCYEVFGDEETLKQLHESLNVLREECYNQIAGYYSRALDTCTENQRKKRLTLVSQETSTTIDDQSENFWKIPVVTPYTDVQLKETESKISKNLEKSTSIIYRSSTTLSKDVTSYIDVYLKDGILDLNGHTLTVYGNFYHTGGHLYVNNGKLIVKGSYFMRQPDGMDENGLTKYKKARGTINLFRDGESITIGKDFVFYSDYSCRSTAPKDINDLKPDKSDNAFYKGMIKVGGDIYLDRYIYVFDTFEFRLTGGHPHTIENNDPNSRDMFYNLTFEKTGNKSEKKNDNVLYWSGRMGTIKLTDDVTIYLMDREKIGKKEYGVFYGDGNFGSGGCDLNGHTMTLKGNVFCKSGTFNINKGTMHVTGDLFCRNYFRLDNDGNPDFVTPYTKFYMIYDKDLLDIDGTFTWSSACSFTENQNYSQWFVKDTNVMKAGKIKIGGNFIHEEGFFAPTGSNVVEMDGKGKKIIAVKGKINILKLDQPMSKYTINPDDCYTTLYQNYHIKFDGNGAKSGKMSNMEDCAYGKKYQLKKNLFKRPGYVFTGWNTKKNGTGKKYKDKAAVKNLTKKNNTTVTLYAQWKKK